LNKNRSELSRTQVETREVYEKLFFQYSDFRSPELTAEGRKRFHEAEYYRVLALGAEDFKNLSILETGCGPGSHSLIISALIGPAGRLRSFDLSPINIEKAKRLLLEHGAPRNYRFDVTDAESFSSEEDFDVVFSHNWLHHSDDPIKSLFNIIRPLKIGGFFYLCTYQARTFRALICEFIRSKSVNFSRDNFLRIVPFFFPTGFTKFNFYQIIHYENIIDDYLVPNVRFSHLDHLAPALSDVGLNLVDAGVSSLLRKENLFEIEEIPLKVAFKKTAHFDDYEVFKNSIGDRLFSKTVPTLPPRFSHLQDLVEQAFGTARTRHGEQGEMFLAMAMHRLRCEFATVVSDAVPRFIALERVLNSIIKDDNSVFSLHSGEQWATKRHPLADEIIRTTPFTAAI
jgi:SAM-dependent methyltransferase